MMTGTYGVPWPLVGTKTEETVASPRVLLVDDDPVFCKKVQRNAKRLHLDVTVCKTPAEVQRLPNLGAFDVAVLDYFIPGVTAMDLSRKLGEKIPIVLVSNTEAWKLSGENWPPVIRSFVHKSMGPETILAEAMLTARWGNLFPKPAKESGTHRSFGVLDVFWKFPMATAIVLGAIIAFLFFTFYVPTHPKLWKWDKAPIESLNRYSHLAGYQP